MMSPVSRLPLEDYVLLCNLPSSPMIPRIYINEANCFIEPVAFALKFAFFIKSTLHVIFYRIHFHNSFKMAAHCVAVLLAILYNVSYSAATINCTQIRVPGSPGQYKLEHTIFRYANETCRRLKSDKLQVHSEGYELTVSAWPIELNTCTSALEQLVQECVTNRTYFGGIIAFEDRTYNLSNMRYPSSPLRTRLHHSHTSTGTVHSYTSNGTVQSHTSTGTITTMTSSTSSCHRNTASPVPPSSVIQAFKNANSSVTELKANPDYNVTRQNAISAVSQAANGMNTLPFKRL